MYENDVHENGIIIPSKRKGNMQDIQEVVAVSEYAESRGIKVGDLIYVDLTKYVKMVPAHNYDSPIQRTQSPEGKTMVPKFEPPITKINDEIFFSPDYSDIDYIVTEWDELEETGLILPDNKIIETV